MDLDPTHGDIVASTPKEPKEVKEKRRRRKKSLHKSKMITGYIIYASEIRKDIIKQYPDRDFGFISKVVGVEWKNLPQEEKMAYEKRAQEQNAIYKAMLEEEKANQIKASPMDSNSNDQSDITMTDDQATMSTTINDYSVSEQYTDSMNVSQPLHIIQEEQSSATTVRYGSSTIKKTNIVYRRPTSVRLKPKDMETQTEPIKWIKTETKPLRFSQTFIDYLATKT